MIRKTNTIGTGIDLKAALSKLSRHRAQALLENTFNRMGNEDALPHLAAFGKLYQQNQKNQFCDYMDLIELWMRHNEPRQNKSGGRKHNLGYTLLY